MTTERVAPTEPPISTADLPGTGGTVGPDPEDFVVDEVPLYAASGEGEHLYVRLRKRRMTTRDAVRALSDATGIPANEIGTAGMKDKHAVTTQWVSLPARRAASPESWQLPDTLQVVETARHGNKLRTGHLSGNRFRIRITSIQPGALENGQAVIARLHEHGLPNYFGAQRFGWGGAGLADALSWLSGEAGQGARRRVPPFERKLFASVVQAEVFNRYTTARLAEGLSRPLLGEVVRLANTGSSFVVEDEAREAPRWKEHDLVPTGPITGPKMRAAREKALVLEEAALSSLGLDQGLREALARHGDGTRRDLLIWPEQLSLSDTGDGALTVEMFLPSGSYATVLVRELTREPFFSEERHGSASQ